MGSGEGRGSYNVMVGYGAGYHCNGASNIYIGTYAGGNVLGRNGDGDAYHNTMIGVSAGRFDTLGYDNTYLGYRAGEYSKGHDNVFIGQYAGRNEKGSYKLYIDVTETTSPLIWGDFLTDKVQINGDLVVTGNFTSPSDSRLKKDISPLPGVLEKVVSLQPVTYHWDRSRYPVPAGEDRLQIGVVAQQVEKLFPELVRTTSDGYLSVDYMKLSVVLLKALQEQQALIQRQESDLQRQVREMEKLKEKVEALQRLLESLR